MSASTNLGSILDFKKLYATDATAAQAAPAISATPPANMIPMEGFSQGEILFYGNQAAGTAACSIWLIRRVGKKGNVMYVPTKVATFTASLGASANMNGVAGGLVDNTSRFARAFSVAVATFAGGLDYLANIFAGITSFGTIFAHSPADDVSPAALAFRTLGYHGLVIQLTTITTITKFNGVYSLWI